MQDEKWEYDELELKKIQDNAGELYQVVQELYWNTCNTKDNPKEMLIYKTDHDKLGQILRKINIM